MKQKRIISLATLLLIMLSIWSQDSIVWPGGRYAITADGNMHDPDDIGAIPMSIATMCYAGFKDKIVHFDYANHLGLNTDWKYEAIQESCNKVVEYFKIDKSIFFNCQKDLEAAKANFLKEALKCTEKNPLWLVCAGPMGTAYIYLSEVKKKAPDKLKYIHCVSHSVANNKHNDTPELAGKTWIALKTDFPEVTYHDIKNQNNSDGFCSPLEKWSWMIVDGAHEHWKWLYSRNHTAEVNKGMFDISDGGMTYWLISGATNGGNEHGNWDDIHAVFRMAKK